jgi:hypothetical protein
MSVDKDKTRIREIGKIGFPTFHVESFFIIVDVRE